MQFQTRKKTLYLVFCKVAKKNIRQNNAVSDLQKLPLAGNCKVAMKNQSKNNHYLSLLATLQSWLLQGPLIVSVIEQHLYQVSDDVTKTLFYWR